MEIRNQATRIRLLDLRSIQMRSFHITWLAFFLCFFGWFGIAPLMAVVRHDLGLTKAEVGNTIIASVAITVLVRMLIGPLCDRIGPRRTYTGLLVLGSLPVMAIGLADSYASFLLLRLAIGAIGASFVITQYHTSVMFAPNVVGTANATTAGWGNLGGGVTQMVMPLVFAAVMTTGVEAGLGWRLAMVAPGLALLAVAALYWFGTRDCPDGDYRDLRAQGRLPTAEQTGSTLSHLATAARDGRVWALFVVYGACFGVELTINNIAAIYFFDRFSLGLETAGLIAGLFGLMNIFARSLGGFLSDHCAARSGLRGRVAFLFLALFVEGLGLILFSQMTTLVLAVGAMLVFSLFVQMSEGATYGVVPFVNRRVLGSVAGIVGAGGNAGAVAAGFLFRSEAITYQQGLLYLGLAVTACSFMALRVRFSEAAQSEEAGRLRVALRRGEPAAAEA
ncbi:MFS transporter, NNP family, nitrate/nitrite transporter [Tistlia consotensis]|uniref:MFS transporter, NNP family, nitrate/nitrite transporter n=1 Tax=Tistlia consotensis USBA 355 TaxID=560819 RepID=A0A1Y6BZF1_9PROT|nr:MFS transporter [Tistlia consotensis]SMF36352.1 MFS transporter, NNP family, nitrate/nitrite transporter [Tistlia consotensis USBA 355]SNR71733.1 MFS transporter, NNP family, nitrate/nitrite transporter [Tistlia consotensis]